MLGSADSADAAVDIALRRILEQWPKTRNEKELNRRMLSQVYDACIEGSWEGSAEPPLRDIGHPAGTATIADWLPLLPPRERATLILTSIERFDYAAVAEITKMSEMTVRMDLAQAREKLRQMALGPPIKGEEVDRSAVAE